MADIVYHISPPVDNADLNALFAAAWPAHSERDFGPILSRSLTYVCAYGERFQIHLQRMFLPIDGHTQGSHESNGHAGSEVNLIACDFDIKHR